MYSTLIVDDEPLMRQYLDKNLSLICPDFYVTGIASDGLEAVELLQKQTFDLVITDIKMPEMDGLKLARHIFDKSPETKVIIISGYNEFEYARLAIKYGVSDYLLKPLSDDNISETLTRMKTELDIQIARRNHILSSSHYLQYSDTEIKSALLSAAITENNEAIQVLYNILKERNLTFMKSYATILLLCIDELHLLLQERRVPENTTYQLELNQRCKAYCNLNDYAIAYDNHGYTVVLLTAENEEDLPVLAKTVYEKIVHTCWNRKQLKILSSFGYGAEDLMKLAASYSSATQALALNLKNAPSPITSNYFISQSKFLNELHTICAALYTDYISKNTNKTLSDLYLYITLFEKEINIAAILRYASYLIRYLAKKCNIRTEHVLSAFRELTNGIDQKLNTDSFHRENVHALFLQVIRVLEHDDVFTLIPEAENIVESAKEFICTHYHQQISLSMVADSLKVNPSYLSDIFHKSIGEPYTKFLTRVRMEQALLLLKSNPNGKVYQIAEKTGFVSAKHFNNVFKKYYGFTPTEYLTRNSSSSCPQCIVPGAKTGDRES